MVQGRQIKLKTGKKSPESGSIEAKASVTPTLNMISNKVVLIAKTNICKILNIVGAATRYSFAGEFTEQN